MDPPMRAGEQIAAIRNSRQNPKKLWRPQRRGSEPIAHIRQHLSLAADLGTSPRPPIPRVEPPEDRSVQRVSSMMQR